MIPRFNDQLHLDPATCSAVLGDAVRLAHEDRRTTVSLTGLVPLGHRLRPGPGLATEGDDLPGSPPATPRRPRRWCSPSAGALEDAGRDRDGEHVGFIGLGSVGIANPSALPLVPAASRAPQPVRRLFNEALESLRRELVDELDYRGEVRLLASGPRGAGRAGRPGSIVASGSPMSPRSSTSARPVPGTIVVDDSAP